MALSNKWNLLDFVFDYEIDKNGGKNLTQQSVKSVPGGSEGWPQRSDTPTTAGGDVNDIDESLIDDDEWEIIWSSGEEGEVSFDEVQEALCANWRLFLFVVVFMAFIFLSWILKPTVMRKATIFHDQHIYHEYQYQAPAGSYGGNGAGTDDVDMNDFNFGGGNDSDEL